MLDKALVIEFLELHAKAASAEKRLEELKAILKPALIAGEESPSDLPYLLVLGNQRRTTEDYKAPLYRLLKRIIGKVRADKRMAQIEAKFLCRDVPTLNVAQNKEFAADLSANVSAA